MPGTSTDVNDYLNEITGKDITAKDSRTWAGTGPRGDGAQ
jgi:DNA topoisomerase-1